MVYGNFFAVLSPSCLAHFFFCFQFHGKMLVTSRKVFVVVALFQEQEKEEKNSFEISLSGKQRGMSWKLERKLGFLSFCGFTCLKSLYQSSLV